MPISRKKSCIHCRRAKARCNLASTCSHCADRGLQCSYAPFSRKVLSAAGPEEPTMLDETSEQSGESYSSAICDNEEMDAFNLTALEPAGFGIDDHVWPTPSWSGTSLPWSMTGEMTSGTFGGILEQPSRPPSSRLCSKNGHLSASGEFLSENNDGAVTIYGHVYRELLCPRNSMNNHSILNARFIWGQLKAYPTLLIHGQLPPFIYPSCVLSDQLPQSCVLNSVHQCLAAPLAVCASIIRIWEARTPATIGLVWRSIYEEVKRLGDEYHEYGDDELLAAYQAISIYLLLQAQDMQHKLQNNLSSMIVTLIEIMRHLSQSQSCSHLPNILALPNLTQRIWAFNESIYRSMALMFILDFVLQEGIVWRRGPTRCGGGDPVPLPGSRYLWDYNIRESWAFRLERSRSIDSSLEPQLTLGDLRKAGEGDESNADRLARWCDSVDEFGGVLWMSATLI